MIVNYGYYLKGAFKGNLYKIMELKLLKGLKQ